MDLEWIRKHKITDQPKDYSSPSNYKVNLPDHVIAQMISLRKEGKTLAAIALVTKSSEATIRKVLTQAGLSKTGGKSRRRGVYGNS